MTSTVGDKSNFAITWNVFNTARNSTHDVSPKYDSVIIGLAEGPLAFHAPERMFLREFRIQPLDASYDTLIDWISIDLRIGTETIVHHRINKTDSDRSQVKVFFLSGVPTVPATARIWLRVKSGPAPNNNNSNLYSATLWGQWIRD